MIRKPFVTLLCLAMAVSAWGQITKLNGTIIGNSKGYDYTTSQTSSTKNLKICAMDGDLDTYYASSHTSHGWVGLDFGSPHVISQVAWAPSNLAKGSENVLLGVFEGANQADFSDAVPLYVIKKASPQGRLSYANVPVTRAFRYVRYVGPAGSRCNVAEIQFWGSKRKGTERRFYQMTNLPTVVIRTTSGNDPTSKTTELTSLVTIISNGGYQMLQDTAGIRGRGNASWGFPKKPYRIKFYHKQRPLDAVAKAKKWTLINNYGDKTLMRNLLAFEVSRRMGIDFVPWSRAVDVILNGEYKGCYQLTDQVEVRKGRVDITEMDETCIEGDLLTGGYLIEVDKHAPEEPKYFITSRGTPVTIKYPDDEDIMPQQYKYIRDYYSKFENTLFRATIWRDSIIGYRSFLNLPSFLRHFLVGEFSGNTDTYWSTYMYKDRNQTQFYVEPPWDFDLAFENDNRTYPICGRSDYIYRTVGSHAGKFNTIVDRIVISDPNARKDLQAMWATVRDQNLIELTSLQAYVDSIAAEIYESQELNFIRWPIMRTKVHQNPVLWGSFDAEVQNVKDYLERRIAWMDNKLRYQPGASSINTAEQTQPTIRVRNRSVLVGGVPPLTPFYIYNLGGTLVSSHLSSQNSDPLPPGTYVIKVNNFSMKVLIK